MSFGAELARSQRLTIARDAGRGAELTIDAAVEIDFDELRLAGFLVGQRILLLSWNGAQLQESRAALVPAALRGRDILRDLQLVYWPAEAIRAQLGAGWTLEEEPRRRRLLRAGVLVFESERDSLEPLGDARLVNHLGHYRIAVQTSHDLR